MRTEFQPIDTDPIIAKAVWRQQLINDVLAALPQDMAIPANYYMPHIVAAVDTHLAHASAMQAGQVSAGNIAQQIVGSISHHVKHARDQRNIMLNKASKWTGLFNGLFAQGKPKLMDEVSSIATVNSPIDLTLQEQVEVRAALEALLHDPDALDDNVMLVQRDGNWFVQIDLGANTGPGGARRIVEIPAEQVRMMRVETYDNDHFAMIQHHSPYMDYSSGVPRIAYKQTKVLLDADALSQWDTPEINNPSYLQASQLHALWLMHQEKIADLFKLGKREEKEHTETLTPSQFRFLTGKSIQHGFDELDVDLSQPFKPSLPDPDMNDPRRGIA